MKNKYNYYKWERWNLGHGEYKKYGPRNHSVKPYKKVPPEWWIKFKARQALKKITKYPTPNPIWRLPAVGVIALSSFHGILRDAAWDAGYRRIDILLVEDGIKTLWHNIEELERIGEGLIRRGWTLCGWQVTTNIYDPNIEAYIGYDVGTKVKMLSGWNANCESWYEHNDAWRSRVYVDKFTSMGKFPLAVWPLGSDTSNHARPFDYLPWLEKGAMVYPQQYQNINIGYSIASGLENLDKAKVPKPNQGVSPGVYGQNVPWDAYARDLAARPTPVLLYIGERVSKEEWNQKAGKLIVR